MTLRDSAKATVYKLGRVAFTVEAADPAFINQLDVLLPRSSGHSEVETVHSKDLRDLQNHIFKMHTGCLWLDAGCLIAPNGKKILIVGRSGAGKSTTTMALALAYGWKVIAEDILLIDHTKDELITFGAPFSLKPGTEDLLRSSIARVPDPIINLEWSPLGDMAAPNGENSYFNICIVFSRNYDDPKFRVTKLSPGSFVRKCLPVSNLLRIDGGSEKLLDYVSNGNCLEIEDGTLTERLTKILQLCD